jgi:hypothetical protein
MSRTSFFAARLATGIRCEGGASYCLVSGRQPPRIVLFSRRWRPVEPASSQPVLRPAPAAKAAHLTVSFLAVNPLETFLFSRCWRPVEAASSQPVFQPAPAAKGAHLTVWLQGVNTLSWVFFGRRFRRANPVESGAARELRFAAAARICKGKQAADD